LHAALIGNSSLFTRQDSVEASWRIVQPLLDAPPPVTTYEPGSWGPEEAQKLISHYGGWRGPWTDD
jgi:glucose-6-phosphate 1-dehydrogenase